MNKFKLKSKYKPAGDQPRVIQELLEGAQKGFAKQTLLGATATGKTFIVANVIEKLQKPTLVIAHNKTLAAQLAQEFRDFFPDNSVQYFVSYYDYYQPEAYMPATDTYIEKDASINEEIDRLRHAATQALLTRKDVIVVASVSCIYGLGSPKEYLEEHMLLKVGDEMSRADLIQSLVRIHYERTNADLSSGTFRALSNKVEIMPISEQVMYSVEISEDRIEKILKIDPVSSKIQGEPKEAFIFPAKHFITSEDAREAATKSIEAELKEHLAKMEREGKLLEVERLKRRTRYDLAMIREIGYCSGIENYSRHLSGKKAGEPPETLLSYFPRNKDGESEFLTIIDESHVTLPQLRGMFAGDKARKETLIEHGFRLPSAKDNRPLRYEEFEKRIGQVMYTSATPSEDEKRESKQIVEAIIRPTGLVDPELEVRPITPSTSTFSTAPVIYTSILQNTGIDKKRMTKGSYPGQVQDFIAEAKEEIKKEGRVLATTLTKKMAEDLSQYLKDEDIKAEYLHSDIKTIERIKILTEFRRGTFDILVGVNLLREGLDLPEVSLIGILDADKEGFLRSETSLIQTIGRAARNITGRVILYADQMTGSMKRAIDETNRRREIQLAYNKKHKITPQTIRKNIRDIRELIETEHDKALKTELALDLAAFKKSPKKLLKLKEAQMKEAAQNLDFETAAILRDEIKLLKEKLGKKK